MLVIETIHGGTYRIPDEKEAALFLKHLQKGDDCLVGVACSFGFGSARKLYIRTSHVSLYWFDDEQEWHDCDSSAGGM